MLLGRVQDFLLGLRVLLSGARFLGHHLETPFDGSEVGEHQVEGKLLELSSRIRLRTEAARDLD